MKVFLSNKMHGLIRTISKGLTKKQQLGLIVLGETLGYLCGVPLPLLTVFPFIVAPTLLQPIIKHAYLAIPLGIMGYQINKDPAKYLTGNILSLAAIGGLVLGKKFLAAKAISFINNTLSADLDEDSNSEYEESSNDFDLNVPCLPLSALENLSDEEGAEDPDFMPDRRYYLSYGLRTKNNQRSDDNPLSQPVVFVNPVDNNKSTNTLK